MLRVRICMLVSAQRLDYLTRISHQLDGHMLEEVSLKFDSHNVNSTICNIVQVRGGNSTKLFLQCCKCLFYSDLLCFTQHLREKSLQETLSSNESSRPRISYTDRS